MLFNRITSNCDIKANTRSTLDVKIFSQSQLKLHFSLYDEIQGAKFSHFNRNLGVRNFPVQTLHWILINISIKHCFHFTDEDILKNAGNQTVAGPIHFHCIFVFTYYCSQRGPETEGRNTYLRVKKVCFNLMVNYSFNI